MKSMFVIVLLAGLAAAKDTKRVEVVLTHAVTHEAMDREAKIHKFFSGDSSPTRQVESFNLDAIIDGEHVVLTCFDDNACEAPAKGTYDAEMKGRNTFLKLTFELPVSHRKVTRAYKIAGTW